MPAFAAAVRARFDASLHKTLATLRRDQRLAPHSATADALMAEGDAKIAGQVFEVHDPALLLRLAHDTPDGQITQEQRDELAAQAHLFRVEITEVVLTRLGGQPDHLVIEHWHPGRGLERIERA